MKTLTKTLLLFFVSLTALSTATAQVPGVDHVILIASDGFSAEVLRENPGMFPNIEALMKRGSSTLQCRSVLPSSSAVNWASHLMGAGPELHGYTEWGSKTPELPSRTVTENGTFPCIVWATRQKYPQDEIGVFYPWDGIGYLFDTIAVSTNKFCNDDREMTDRAVEYLKKQPRFAFFYLAEPDHTGHTLGWQSDDYKAMCRQIDGYVGEIIAGIESAGMKDNTVVIFTADHGGIKTGHGGKTMNEMEVPYMLAGPGVKQNYKITESVMNFDDAATIAYILGVDRPQVWIGRPVMSAFETVKPEIIEAAKNKISISLPENPTTGYIWEVQSMSGNGEVKLLNSSYKQDKTAKDMTGVGGVRSMLFNATKGDYIITLVCKRPWEDKVAQTKKFQVTVK